MVLPQIVAVGIYNAQVVLKNKAISKNRKTTMFELELPIGNGGISYIDDESHQINENTVICAKPGQIRHTRLPFKCYYIHMIVSEGYLADILTALPNYIDLSNTDQTKEIFVSLCEHDQTGIESDDILLQSLILKLLYILNQKATPVIKLTPKSNHHKTIERILEYINGNLSADLTLEKLANAANFNTVYFHKLFKASTGKTPHEYIEERRIKKSVNLLISTDMTLAQIAYECGFSSQSYFSYAFKRRMGASPRDYAKQAVVRYNEK
jgi:AraC-like DNA-binding protein